MSIAKSHKESKKDEYWKNLTQGITSQYKAQMIDELLEAHFHNAAKNLLDVGCGTSEIIIHYNQKFHATHAVCVDYDENIVAKMKKMYADAGLIWQTSDLLELGKMTDRFDLIFVLDIIHEIYSFYGRAEKDIKNQVDHHRGIEYVKKSFAVLAELLNQGGGIVLTDNILPDEDMRIRFRPRNPGAKTSVAAFLKQYPSKTIAVTTEADSYGMNLRDFCILLTQYNKIKSNDLARWNVERFEIHQYMSRADFEATFSNLGFNCFFKIGTPAESLEEWESDFELLEGIQKFPPKRVTLLAVKK